MGGGVGGGQKTTPLFLGSRIMNLLVFLILSRKSVSGPLLHGVSMGRSGTSAIAVDALYAVYAGMQFMHFSAIFAMLAVLATSVTPWYPL